MTISRIVSDIKKKKKKERKESSGNCLRSHIMNKNDFIIICITLYDNVSVIVIK
jgi:hypothetical protein